MKIKLIHDQMIKSETKFQTKRLKKASTFHKSEVMNWMDEKCPEVDLHWSWVEVWVQILARSFVLKLFLWAVSKLIIKSKPMVQFAKQNNVQTSC